mgnify:CR=1 FL=1
MVTWYLKVSLTAMLSSPARGEQKVLQNLLPSSAYIVITMPLSLEKPLATARAYCVEPAGMADLMECIPWNMIGKDLEASK